MGHLLRIDTETGVFELVFGEGGKPSVALSAFAVQNEGKFAVGITIRKLKDGFEGSFGEHPRKKDLDGEAGHIIFVEEGSLLSFKHQIDKCLEIMRVIREVGMEKAKGMFVLENEEEGTDL